tara:strand:+ start:435 stop:716 length:282 start_codon:yes stop_codon:yes gene_type:complete
MHGRMACSGAQEKEMERVGEMRCVSGEKMSTVFVFATVIVMLLVVFFLARGLINMMLGGSPQHSNKMMQARVAFQALAIILIMITLWLMQSGH